MVSAHLTLHIRLVDGAFHLEFNQPTLLSVPSEVFVGFVEELLYLGVLLPGRTAVLFNLPKLVLVGISSGIKEVSKDGVDGGRSKVAMNLISRHVS